MPFSFFTAKKDWEKYYGDIFQQTEQLYYVGNDIVHRYFTSGNVYVKNSLFESLKASTNGGGICCENVPNFLAEDTQFVTCTTTQSGGAIHFSYSNIVLHRVCGFDCRTLESGTNKDGPFANTYVTRDAKSKNFIIESQISHCTNPKYGYTVSMHYGNVSFQYANESRNSCKTCSVFRLESDNSYCVSSYNSFCNNQATNLCFNPCGNQRLELLKCNFISNSAQNQLFYNQVPRLVIKDSCLLDNKCPSDYFYHVGSSQYEIINCTLDCKGKMSGNYFITGSMYASSSFIVALNLLNTGNCYGTYDVINSLTPIIPTPNKTPNPTKNLYILSCSCQRNKSILLSLSYLTSILYSK